MSSVTVTGIRSIWGEPLRVPVSDDVTLFVGPHRSGASSVLFAVAASLAPATLTFDPARDLPFDRPLAGLLPTTAGPASVAWDTPQGQWRVAWDSDGRPESATAESCAAWVVYCPVDAEPGRLVAAANDLDSQRLAASVEAVARRVLPEIGRVEISGTSVSVFDDHGALLADVQVRVLVALGIAGLRAQEGSGAIQAPGDRGRAGLLAIEAPEAFLHPAAQEALAAAMAEIAAEPNVRVMAATMSPFVIARTARTLVVALARGPEGSTTVIGSARGDEPQSHLLGGLLRDDGFAAVFDRLGRIPPGTRAVLVVEGGTDEAYLRLAAGWLARTDLLADVAVWPSGGAMGVALTAILLRAEVAVPVVVLLDHDVAGRRARDTLVSRFGFLRSVHVVTYADVFDGVPTGVEAETLFDEALMQRFVETHPPSALKGPRREQGVTTIDLTPSGKAAFVGWLERFSLADDLGDLGRWAALFDVLAGRFAALESEISPAGDDSP